MPNITPAATPTIFNFDNSRIRTINKNGEPWFVAADVCSVLDIGNVSMAIQRLDEEEVTLSQIEGSHRPTNIVNESGLYSLVLRSDKPEAKRFKKWITSEVLPTIRKTGGYQLPQTYPDALRALADTAELANRLAAQLEDAQEAVAFRDVVTASYDLCSMDTAAKILAIPWMGGKKMFDMLRQLGVLSSGGSRHNVPKQYWVNRGFFVVKERPYQKPSGEVGISFTTKVTQKGLDFIRAIITTNVDKHGRWTAPSKWELPDRYYDRKEMEQHD